jgi:AraC-like DNA-binding protein
MKASLLMDAPILDKRQLWIKKVEKPYFTHDFHYHKTCELLWIAEGRGTLIVGDYIGKYEEDDLFLMGTGLPHIFRSAKEYHKTDSSLKTVAIAIYFTDEFLSQLCDAPGYSMEILEMQNRSERGLRITGPCRRDLISLFNEVISSEGIAQLGRFLTMLDRILKVPEYQSLTSSAYKIRPPKREMDRFIEVYDYILKNFQGTITLTKAAAICGMSENAFCRFFKSRTQRTLTQFVNEIRISHACSLLREQNDPLKNIYRQCGYNNAVFFHRSFKRITGLTPKQYQENCHAV